MKTQEERNELLHLVNAAILHDIVINKGVLAVELDLSESKEAREGERRRKKEG